MSRRLMSLTKVESPPPTITSAVSATCYAGCPAKGLIGRAAPGPSPPTGRGRAYPEVQRRRRTSHRASPPSAAARLLLLRQVCSYDHRDYLLATSSACPWGILSPDTTY